MRTRHRLALLSGSASLSAAILLSLGVGGSTAAHICGQPLATKTWDSGGTTANWNEAANWSGDTVPGANDYVCIPDDPSIAATVVNATFTIKALESVEPLSMAGNTLTVSDPATATELSTFTFSGGTFAGAGNRTITTEFNWVGGELTGGSSTTVPATAVLKMAGTTKYVTGSHQLTNNSTTTTDWTGGDLWMYGTPAATPATHFNNNGTIRLVDDPATVSTNEGDVNIHHSGNTIPAEFNNNGTFTKVNGLSGSDTYVSVRFDNNGTVNIDQGRLRLAGGGNDAGPFTLATSGRLQFEGGTHDVGGAITGAGPLATPSGLTATAAPGTGALPAGTYFYKVTALNVNGETTASTEASATLGATGKIGLTWAPVAGAATYRIYRGTASNGQNVFYTSTLASFDDTGTAPTGGSPPAANTSASAVAFSSGTTTVTAPYNVGTTSISGGTNTFTNASTALGTLNVSGGTNRLNITTSPAKLNFSGGDLGGSGTMTIGAEFNWNGGELRDVGTTTVAPAAVFRMGGTTKYLTNSRVFNNNSTTPTDWKGGDLWMYGTPAATAATTFNNNGTIRWVDDPATVSTNEGDTGDIHHSGNAIPARVVNNGTMTKVDGDPSGVSENTYISVPFNNNGSSLHVDEGLVRLAGGGSHLGPFTVGQNAFLRFEGGTHTLASSGAAVTKQAAATAATVQFTGGSTTLDAAYNVPTTTVTGGTHNFNGSTVLSALNVSGGTAKFNATTAPATVNLSGGDLGGTGNMSIGTAFNWTGGELRDNAATTVAAAATFALGGTTKYLTNSRVLNNNSTTPTDWKGGDLWMYGTPAATPATTFNNNGSIRWIDDPATPSTNEGDTGDFHQSGNTVPAEINNNGTFTKVDGDVGGESTYLSVPFENDGASLVVNDGRVRLAAGSGGSSSGSDGISGGSYSAAAGTILDFEGGTHTLGPNSAVTGEGTVRQLGGTTHVNGDWNVAGTTSVSGGTLNLEPSGSGANHSTGTFLLSGGVLGGGGIFDIATLMRWTGGTMEDIGFTTILAGALLELDGANHRYLDSGRTLYNLGTARWSGTAGFTVGGGTPAGGTFYNYEGGLFEITSNETMSFGAGGLFQNQGTLRKHVPGGGLAANHNADAGPGAPNAATDQGSPASWTRTGKLTTVQYGATGGFPTIAHAGTIGGGANFFAGGPADASAAATAIQNIGLSSEAHTAADAGQLTVFLDGYLGGKLAETDNAKVDAIFLNGANAQIGTPLTIGPVTAAQRSNLTQLLYRDASVVAPAGTRSIRLVITATRSGATPAYNDGYADNIRLRIRNADAVLGTTTINVPFDNDPGPGATGGIVEAVEGTLTFNGGSISSGPVFEESTGAFDVKGQENPTLSSSTHGGAIGFGGGTFLLAPTASVTGEGSVKVTGGTTLSKASHDVNRTHVSGGTINFQKTDAGDSAAATTTTLLQTGGVIGGDDTVIADTFDWTDGSQYTGTTRVNLGGTWSTTGAKFIIRGRRVINEDTSVGTIRWTGGPLYIGSQTGVRGAELQNEGVFEVRSDDNIYHYGEGNSTTQQKVHNLSGGVFKKTTTAGTTTVNGGVPFENDGTLDVQTGTLTLNGGSDGVSTGSYEADAGTVLAFGGGTHELDPASSVTTAGTLRVSGGTANIGGALYNVTGATSVTGGTANYNKTGGGDIVPATTKFLSQTGGVVGGDDKLVADTFDWTDGSQYGPGQTSVNLGGTWSTGGAKFIIRGRKVVNEDTSVGTITWTGGPIYIGSQTGVPGAELQNKGVFDVRSNENIYHYGEGTSTTQQKVHNMAGGVFKKTTAAAGTTTVNGGVPFVNDGLLKTEIGTINLAGLFTNNGTADIGAGTTVTSPGTNEFTNYNSTSKTLSGGTYLIAGAFRFANADIVNNAADITLDGLPSALTDTAATPLNGLRSFAKTTPAGSFTLKNDRDLTTPANFTNEGVLDVASSNSIFQATTALTNAATTGLVKGVGTVKATVTNNGTFAPGASPGILTVDGDYTQSGTGTLEIEVAGTGTAGTDYDRLAVTGTATLDGTVTGTMLGGFAPVTAVGIDVVTAATRNGTFDFVTSTPSPLPGNLVLEARYDPTTAKLFAVPGGGAADDSVSEGAGTKTVSVTLSAPSSEQITINYATADGTASAETDYQSTSGTLTFAPDQTTRTFDVTIVDDARDEPDQTFLVNLSSPTSTVLTDAQATITILDNDLPPTVSIADVERGEGSAGTTPFNFNVTLSAASEKEITVQFATLDDTATQPADYATKSGTVTFAALDTLEQVTVDVDGDTRVESDERFFVDLSSPVNSTIAKARGTGSILDDDLGGAASQLSINDVAVTEIDGAGATATFTVTLSPAATTPVSVQYATSDGSAVGGSDFTAVPSDAPPLAFAVGETTKTITVPITGDNLDEPSEAFSVVLSGPVGASLADAVGTATIADDDAKPVLSTEATLTVLEDPLLPEDFELAGSDADDAEEALVYEIVTAPVHGSLTGPDGAVVHYQPNVNYHGDDGGAPDDLFTVRVSDGVNSAVGTYAVEITSVNDAPVASAVTRAFAEDTSETITLLATDVEGDALTFSKVAETNGAVSIDGNQATFTPTANYNGPASFTFKANDGSGPTGDSNTATASLTITPVNDAPVANDATDTTAEDTAKAITLTSSDVEGSPRTYSIVSGPAHGTLSAITGNSVTYTPAGNYSGADSFRFKANDGAVDSTPATISISVTPVNDQPVAANGVAVVSPGAAETITLSATDVDGNPLTYSIVGTPPTKGSLSAVTGNQVTYTANPGTSGSDQFSFKANDGTADSNEATVAVTITAVGGASQLAVADAAAVTEGDSGTTAVTFGVTLGPAASSEVTVNYAAAAGTATSGADFEAANGTLTFAAGETTKSVTVNVIGDRLDEANETFAVNLSSPSGASLTDAQAAGTITDDDDSPVAAAQATTTDEDTAKAITLGATDGDGDVLTYAVATPPAHGMLSGTGAARTYTPDPNYNGPDSFAFRANDGVNDSNVATVSITVNAANDSPVAANTSATLIEDGSGTITLPAADIDSASLTYTAFDGTNGSVSVSGNQATFTPTANYNGSASFKFKANDGSLDSNEATVSLTVTPVNDAPVANDATDTTAEDTAKAITLTSSDVEASPRTYSIVSGPGHGTLSAIDGNSVTYTPAANYNGADSFRFKANDGSLDSASATISISVTPANDAPVATDDDSITVEGAPRIIDVVANDDDVDGNTLSVTEATDGEKGETLVLDDGRVRYTPAAGEVGDDSFTYTVSDGTAQDTGTVSIEIVPAGSGGATLVSLDDGGIAEGNAGEQTLDVTVELSREATVPVEVRVSTNNGTATGGPDYGALNNQRVDFAVGESEKTVRLKIKGDTLDEHDETFSLVVSSSSGAGVGDGSSTVTITDDDPEPSLSIGSVDVNEGNAGSQTAVLGVTLSAPSGKTIGVDYATADGTADQPADYTPTSGRLTFAPGETSKTITVSVHGDPEVELNETLTVQLAAASNAGLAAPTGTVTVVNDDSLLPPQPPPLPPPAVPTADLALTMTGPATSAVDRAVTFAIGVRNNGPDAASGVVVTDTLAAGLQLVSANVGNIACSGTQTVSCPIGALASGATAAVTVIATTLEPGVHTNTAAVAGQQADPAAGNNSASATTRVPLPVVRGAAGGASGAGGGCTQRGTSGDDVLRGGPSVDVLCGGGGNDILIGFGGNDRLLGGAGNDRIMGGPGSDNLKGGAGKDSLLGGAGKDRLDGGRGRDMLVGGRGNDVLLGSFGNDLLIGGPGKDRNLGGPGKDTMRRDGQDESAGGPGADRCGKGVGRRCP